MAKQLNFLQVKLIVPFYHFHIVAYIMSIVFYFQAFVCSFAYKFNNIDDYSIRQNRPLKHGRKLKAQSLEY